MLISFSSFFSYYSFRIKKHRIGMMIFFLSSFSYALHISNMCFFFPLAITNINMLQTRSIHQSVSHPRPYEATIQIHSPCCSCDHSCELYISISVCLFCVLVAALQLPGRLGCMSVASNWGLINLFFSFCNFALSCSSGFGSVGARCSIGNVLEPPEGTPLLSARRTRNPSVLDI